MLNTDKVDSSYLELLLELKRVIMKQLKVATLGIVKSIDPDKKTLKVKPFPILVDEQEKYIDCRYFNNAPTIDSVVLILFLDRNFHNNLKRIEKGDLTIAQIDNNIFHTEDYAIAIQML